MNGIDLYVRKEEDQSSAEASWLNRAATEVHLLGTELGGSSISNCEVKAASYDQVEDLVAPHLAVLLMPDRYDVSFEPGDGSERRAISTKALARLADVPILVSTCFKLPLRTSESLESLGDLLLLPETRCPFSSSAGDVNSQFADNSWVISVRGPDALQFLLKNAARSSCIMGLRFNFGCTVIC